MKNTINYAIIISAITALMACSSGGSCTQCAIPATIESQPIVVPAGFEPFGTDPAAGNTSPVLINPTYTQIAVPLAASGNTSYVVYNNPPILQNAIAASTDVSKISISTSGDLAIISIPTASPEPTVYVLLPANQTPPPYLVSGGSNTKNQQESDYSYVLVFPKTTNSQNSDAGGGGNPATTLQYYVPLPIVTNIQPVYQLSNTQKTNIDSSLTDTPIYYKYPLLTQFNGCTSSPGIPTTVSTTVYNGTYYVGAGTNNGTVCGGNVATDFSSVSWTNLSSSSWTTRYTPQGPIVNLSFPDQSSQNILGYWNVNTTTPTVGGATIGNTIYRVTGIQNGSPLTPTGFQPTSFWNVSINTKQTCNNAAWCSGSSITFSNSPANGYSMLADSALNNFVGTTNGLVYKLGLNSATWSSISLQGISGNVSLSPTSTGVGVIATGINSSGKVVAYQLQ